MKNVIKILGLIVKLPFDLIIGIITGIIQLIQYFTEKGDNQIKDRYQSPKKLK